VSSFSARLNSALPAEARVGIWMSVRTDVAAIFSANAQRSSGGL
jgi:hypothetical protein